ncbi:MAG: carotenoid 1,2-hydratase, partial [Herminiimonas sp.]|nr:carotenoid 1,2-hydratase [Herminiimonas sp.]
MGLGKLLPSLRPMATPGAGVRRNRRARMLVFFLLNFFVACAFAAAPQFTQVTPGKAIVFPRDSGAHPGFRTEWWYATGWLETPDGKPLGFQVTFFRFATDHDPANPSRFAPKQLIVAHAALSDPAVGKLLHDQKSARAGFGLAYAKEGNTDVKLDDWRLVRDSNGRY